MIFSIVEEVKSWIESHDEGFQKKMNDCLKTSLNQAIQQLFCKGSVSRENISVLRDGFFKSACSKSNDLFCIVLMGLTEPGLVDIITGVMEETAFCNKSQSKVSDQATFYSPYNREKRQYDMVTLYKTYVHIFCNPPDDLTAIYSSNDPGSLQKLSPEMKLLIVSLRFRGSICCVADLGISHG